MNSDTPRAVTTVRVFVHGFVQGVSYRRWLQGEALERGLSGWVRNRLDGSVEAVVSGEPEAIGHIVEKARHGPPTAQVSDVSVMDDDGASAIEGKFEQRPTA